jgi:uncharacterized membrane protein YedE/YeeE
MNLFPQALQTLFCFPLGIAFGFLLVKATVSRFDTIVGQLILRDFTVMKVILTAIAVGSIGIQVFYSIGVIPTLHLSTTPLLLSAMGGGIFGIGMSLTGYCPGTALAALGEGSKDMIFGLLGMFVGAALFNEISPSLTGYLEAHSESKTLDVYFGVSSWVVIGGIIMMWGIFYLLMSKLLTLRIRWPM